jgi:hypothetical protein
MMRWMLCAAVLLLGCTTYRDLLDRGQRLYQAQQFERALANWRALEPDMEALTWADQTRYAFLRGMTDLELGFRDDARHWLAMAKAIDAQHPGGLPADWKRKTESALATLNEAVYAAGASQVTPPQ